MKKFTCYDCEEVFEAEESQEMLNKLYTHYMKDHKEIVARGTEEKKNAWIEKFNKDWADTKEE